MIFLILLLIIIYWSSLDFSVVLIRETGSEKEKEGSSQWTAEFTETVTVGLSVATYHIVLITDLRLFANNLLYDQELREVEYTRRTIFFQLLLNNFDNILLGITLLFDEGWFCLSGVANSRNKWSAENRDFCRNFFSLAPSWSLACYS